MHSATRFFDTTVAVGFEFDADVEVRHHIKSGKAIKQVAPLYTIHAAENNIAFRDRLDGAWRRQIIGDDFEFRAESHSRYCPRHNLYLGPLKIGVLAGGIENAVQV